MNASQNWNVKQGNKAFYIHSLPKIFLWHTYIQFGVKYVSSVKVVAIFVKLYKSRHYSY